MRFRKHFGEALEVKAVPSIPAEFADYECTVELFKWFEKNDGCSNLLAVRAIAVFQNETLSVFNVATFPEVCDRFRGDRVRASRL